MNWKTGGGSVINLIQRNADLLPLRLALMCFMAEKPLVIEYLEPKTFEGVMKKYAEMY
jgi:hypothetical protein